MHRKVSVRFKIALCASIVVIAAVVGWQVARQEQSPVGVEELKIDLADIRSFAAEGSLLATQQVGTSVTRSYAKVQTEMWRQKINELAQEYESREPQVNLTQAYGDVRALADQLRTAADEVSSGFAQNQSANAATAHLQEVESRARALILRLEREAD